MMNVLKMNVQVETLIDDESADTFSALSGESLTNHVAVLKKHLADELMVEPEELTMTFEIVESEGENNEL